MKPYSRPLGSIAFDAHQRGIPVGTISKGLGVSDEEVKEVISSRVDREKRKTAQENAEMANARAAREKFTWKRVRFFKALSMRRSGMTYKQIGQELGVCTPNARVICFRALRWEERCWFKLVHRHKLGRLHPDEVKADA